MPHATPTPGLPALLVALAAAAPAPAQVLGGALVGLTPAKLAHTDAETLAEYRGRLLLVEYFAYW